MSRVRKRYPRAWRPAAVGVVLILVAAVTALFLVPTMVSGVGDPWANSVYSSYRVKDPTFAVGAPDSSYARLEFNGYLDLDMGVGEEVHNGPGDDLTVYGKGTSVYAVYAWDGSWQFLGTGSAESSFDLGGLMSTQLVRILPWPSRIYVDAVGAGYVEPWNELPQPSFTSPDEGERLTEDCVLVVAEDLSGEEDIVGCDFLYYYDVNCNGADDDGNVWTQMEECLALRVLGAGNCSAVWNVLGLPDCCYIIKVSMEDEQAQVGNATRNVELSKNNPEPEVVDPAWDEFTDCGNTTLSGVVTLSAVDGNTTDQGMDIDLGQGNSSVRFMYCYGGLDCVCDTGWSEIPGTVVQHDGVDGRYWTIDWDTTEMLDCCHRVRVEMTDKHGLSGNSTEYCVALSNHVPELVFVEPDECDTVSGNVTLRVEDVSVEQGEDVDFDCVSFYYCNSTSNECPCGPDCAGTWVLIDQACGPDGNMTWSVEWDTSGVEDCYHVVKANVTDNHGLEGNGTVCIGVANDPPQPRITSPTTGEVYGGNVTITVVDDSGAGDIAGAFFYYWYDGNCTSYGNCTDPGETADWVLIGEDDEPGDGMSITWDTSGLPDCCYVVAAAVADVHMLYDYDIVCIELANRFPDPEIVDPPDGCFENDALSGVVTITASDFGLDGGADIDIVNNPTGNCSVGFAYCYDGVDGGCDCSEWTAIPGPVTQHEDGEGRYWTVSWNTTALEDCCHRLQVYMRDMHNLAGFGYSCVGVNNNDPVAHIVAPCDSGNVTECDDCLIGGNVTVTVEETSGAQDLGWAEFYYYDDPDGNCTADDGNEWVQFATSSELIGNTTFTASFNTTSLEVHDCCHILKAVVYDLHGGAGEDTMCIAVSNNPPEPVMEYPYDSEEYCWDNWINFDWMLWDWYDPVPLVAFDNSPEQGADIASCTFEIWDDFNQNCSEDDGNSTWVEIGSGYEDGGDWVFWWDSWSVPDECYLIRANMTDEHGRSGYSEWINVYVNWQRPAPYIRELIDVGGQNITHPDGDTVYCNYDFDILVVDVCNSTDIEDVWAEYWDEANREWVEIGAGYYWQYNTDLARYEWVIEDCLLPCSLNPGWVYIRVMALDKYWLWYDWWYYYYWDVAQGERQGSLLENWEIAGMGSTIIEVDVVD